MKKFLTILSIAVLAVVSLCSHAQTQTYYRYETQRLGYDGSVRPGGAEWSAEKRWTDSVSPGINENYIYRTWLGFDSRRGISGNETDLIVDMRRSVTIGGVTTTVPIRVSSFVSDNHWNTPFNLSASGSMVLEMMVHSDPEKTALGFNLMGFENRKGIGGSFVSSSGVLDFASLNFNVTTPLKLSSTGTVKRSAIRNNGSGVYTFSGNIDARDLTVPDFSESSTGVVTYSDLLSSGIVFEVVHAFNNYITGGNIVVNSKIIADGMTAEFRKAMTETGKVVPIGSVTLPEPQIIVGGAESNTFKNAIVSTDTTFAKTAKALVLQDASPSLIIENGATLTYGNSNQVPSNTTVTFRNPISEPVFNPNGASTGETCDNIAGTLALNGNSQTLGDVTVSRMGAAPVIAVVDFGNNDANQVVSLNSFELAANVDKSASRLHFKNYKVGADHIYVKEKPASSDEVCIYITELSSGKTAVAGAQSAGELGWEYLPDIIPLSSNPINISAGMSVTLTLGTSLTPVTWYVSKDGGVSYAPIDNASGSTYTFIAGDNEHQNNYLYKCKAGSGASAKDSGEFKLVILDTVKILKQPENIGGVAGQKATISVTASGSKLAYQWFYSIDGVNWVKIDGATASEYTFTIGAGDDGKVFRCEITNPLTTSPVISNSATLAVGTPVVILESPQEALIITSSADRLRENAKFTCLVETGTSQSAFWEVSTNGGASWTQAGTGTFEDTPEGRLYVYEFLPAANLKTVDGMTLYRCTALNKVGTKTSSEPAPLYASPFFTYIIQPVDYSASIDGTFTFFVKFICYKDTPVTGTMQVVASVGSTTATRTYEGLTNKLPDGSYSNVIGVTDSVSTLVIGSFVPMDFNGAPVTFNLTQKATYDKNNNMIHSGVSSASKSATIYIYSKPVITLQPKNAYISPDSAGNLPDVTFTVEAVGESPLSYQWQRAVKGSTAWSNISGANTNSFTETYATNKVTGMQYKCNVTNIRGSVSSKVAIIVVNPPINIDPNYPADAKVGLYGSTEMKAVASVEKGNLSYQWYFNPSGNKDEMEPIYGATSPTLSLKDLPFAYNGYVYQCQITNYVNPVLEPENIMIAYTRVATLIVNPTPIILEQPNNSSIIEGGKATFKVSVDGGRLTYKWYVSKDGGVSWLGLPNSNSPTYTTTAEYEMKGWLYYCEISYPGGSINSNQVSLTVSKPVIFTEQPQKFESFSGQDARFNVVTYCAEPGVTFKWQYTNGDPERGKWTDFTTSKNGSHLTQNLLFTASSNQVNTYFRCVASNYMGIEFYSNPAILWVFDKVSIVRQIGAASSDSSYIYALNNVPSSMSIGVVGKAPITYQWQVLDLNKTIQYSVYKCPYIDDIGSPCGYVYDETSEAVKWVDLPSTWFCPHCASYNTDGSIARATYKASFVPEIRTSTAWEGIAGATASVYNYTPSSDNNGKMFRCIASNGGGSAISDPVTLVVRDNIELVSTSGSQAVFDGQSIVLSVDVKGGERAYQWWTSSDNGRTWTAISGADSAEYIINNADAASMMNNLFYCMVTNGIDSSTIKTPTMTIGVFEIPQISPDETQITAGDTAVITLDNPAVAYQDYQWSVSKDNGATWTKLDGKTGTTLEIATTIDMNNYLYRCDSVLKSSKKTASSNTSKLSVHAGIVVTLNPVSTTVKAGDSATFKVTASGEVNYQWQYFDFASATWLNVTSSRFTGAKTATLTLPNALITDTNTQFRCRLTNPSMSVDTASATLSVTSSIVIDVQPIGDVVSYNGGENITLSVKASSDKNLTYQWQKLNPMTGAWENISGATSSSYEILAEGDSTGEYRCAVSNAGMTINSGVSHVTVYDQSAIIASSPIAYVGGDMQLSITPISGAVYQWQQSSDGVQWDNIGGNSSAIAFSNLKTENSGVSYRCVATVASGEIVSKSFVLTVVKAIVITKDIADMSLIGGSDVALKVECDTDASEPTSFQWQYFAYDKGDWSDINDATSSAYLLSEQRSENSGVRYRCKIYNRAQTIYSSAATITVGESYAITPAVALVTLDPATKHGTANFSIGDTGAYSIQWQYSPNNGATWIDIVGANFNAITIDVDASFNAYMYRCSLANASTGVSAKSLTAKIEINTDIKVIAQPKSVAVDSGVQALFTVGISGEATYQWQQLRKSSSTWTNISGATSYQYRITPALSDDGTLYRCAATSVNDATVINSLPAMLTVKTPVSIIITQLDEQAYNINTISGSRLELDVALDSPKSTAGIVYNWQYSSDSGRMWYSVASGNGAAKFILPSIRNNTLYRCVVSNGATSKAISPVYTVNVYNALSIIKSESNRIFSTFVGGKLHYEVAASFGASLIYSWRFGTTVIEMPPTTSTVAEITITPNDLRKYGNCTVYLGVRYASSTASVWSAPMTMTVTDNALPIQAGPSLVFASRYEDPTTLLSPATLKNTIVGPDGMTYSWTTGNIVLDKDTGLPQRDAQRYFMFENSAIIKDATAIEYVMPSVNDKNNDNRRVFFSIAWAGKLGYATNDIQLLVTDPIVVTKQPKSMSLGLYASTLLSAEATTPAIEDDLTKTIYTYYVRGIKAAMPNEAITLPRYSVWQVSSDNGATWRDLTAFTGDTLQLNEVTADMDGNQYRVKYYNRYVNSTLFTDYTWNLIYTDAVTLSVASLPVINGHPQSLRLVEGNMATFTVDYSAGRATLQWQRSTDNGRTWRDIDGAKSSTYSTSTSFSMDGYQYRCFIVNDGGAVISNSASLAVGADVSVSKQPETQEVLSGQVAEFSVVAASSGNFKYQWQVSYNFGTTWVNVSGINGSDKTANLRLAVDDSYQNAVFRCAFTAVTGDKSEIFIGASNFGILHVLPKTQIVSYPKSVDVAEGGQARLYVEATGVSLSYQWQKNVNGVYVNIDGATQSSYIVSNATAAMDGTLYRCAVANFGVVFGFAEITLNVHDAIIIDGETLTVEKYVGDKVVFTFNATSSSTLKYTWEYFDNSKGVWVDASKNIRYAISNNTLTIAEATMDDVNSVFRCVVSNAATSVTTGNMNLIVYPRPQITKTSGNQKAVLGGSVTFFIEASGKNIRYQWQKFDKVQGVYVNIVGANAASHAVSNVTAEMDGDKFACIVSDILGSSLKSVDMTLNIVNTIAVDAPDSVSAYKGESITIALTVVGDTPETTYSWQMFDASKGAWVAATGPNITINRDELTIDSVSLYDNNRQFRCVVSNGGMTVTSPVTKAVVYNNHTVDSADDVIAVVGGSARLVVTATGNELTYQWQKFDKTKSAYVDINGATSSSYVVYNVTKAMDGDEYRCVVSDMGVAFGNGDVTLTVVDIISLEGVPTSVTVYEGNSAEITFTVKNATSATSYAWQIFDLATGTWVNLNNQVKYVVDKNKLTIKTTSLDEDMNGQYRCIVSNGGMSLTTGPINIVVYKKAKLANLELQGGSVKVGQTAYFVATATGEAPMSYKWYIRKSGGSWTEIANAVNSMFFVADVDFSQNGDEYACVVSNAGTPFVSPDTAADNVAKQALVVTWAPEVVTQVQSLEVYEGEKATFNFVVQGQPTIKYQWYESRKGVVYELAGRNSATFELPTTTIGDNGVGYYCVASNPAGEVYSAFATLTVKVRSKAPALAKAGAQVGLEAASAVEGASYQWQVKEPEAAKSSISSFAVRAASTQTDGWSNIEGATSQKLTLTTSYSMASNVYRCVVAVAEAQNPETVSTATTDEIKLSIGETYSTWANANGLAENSADEIAMGSGSVTNIEKYVFALNSAAVSTLQSGITLTKTPAGTTLVNYPVAIYVTDAIVGVQYSTDLKNWTDSSATPKLVNTTELARVYQVELPTTSPKVFVRFKFSK